MWDGRYARDGYWTADGWLGLPDVSGMTSPVRCTSCDHVYDLGMITEYGRYLDCTTWRCPGCKIGVSDRPHDGPWGGHDHHYVELSRDGSEKR
jgi:hypothetical protein